MTTTIATLALLTSLVLLFVHYKNQVERRHGELAKLRSDFIKRLATVHQRYISVQMHLETARLELRSIPDCKDKYESIEKMPQLIDKVQVSLQTVSRSRDYLGDIDTKKLNKSGILLSFQSMDGDIQVIEDDATSIEQETLELLKSIREAGTSRKAGLI